MKKICAAAVLATLSAGAAAEWALVGGVENVFSAYADQATIRRDGSRVDMWGIYDFNNADMSIDGHKHFSTKVLRQYDCGDPRVRLLSYLDYSGRMGAGQVIASNGDTRRWETIVPGSVDEAFWKIACAI